MLSLSHFYLVVHPLQSYSLVNLYEWFNMSTVLYGAKKQDLYRYADHWLTFQSRFAQGHHPLFDWHFRQDS